MYPARSKTKKSAATSTSRESEDDDPVKFVGVCGECDGHDTRGSWHQRVMNEQLNSKVKLEPTYPNLVAGEVICPDPGCMMKIYAEGGCKSLSCKNVKNHRSKAWIYFCGHCRRISPNGDIPKCNCPSSFDEAARLQVHKERSRPFIRLDEDDDDTSDTATPSESTESPIDTADDSESTGSEYGDSDPDYVPSPTPEDQDVTGGEDRSLAVAVRVVSHTIKQEPDVVKSSTYDVKTAYGETGPTPDAVKSEEVLVKVKSEDVKSSGNEGDKKDEGTASSNAEDGEEEDYASLIYQDSQRRKREAAAMAAKSRKRRKASPTSTRKTTAAAASAAKKERSSAKRKRESVEGEEKGVQTAAKKKYWYECSAEGCTNRAVKGGVCIRHGAKVKLCSSDGCTNQAKKGGVCIKHGAMWTKKRCSIEGCKHYAVNRGVCVRHGANIMRKLCSSEGCMNQAKKGGVCIRHGANLL
jgi:hypothetical protein